MPELITIPNWDRDFENAKSRTIERPTFICVQNHFDGKKIRRLQNHRKSLELYGAFHAICAVASKCIYRGVLFDHDGPITALDLSAKTGFPAGPLQFAITELAKIGIGLLEIHPIEFINGKWELPDTVRTWAVHQGSRRTWKAPRDTSRSSADSGGLQPEDTPLPATVNSSEPPRASADAGDTSRPRKTADNRESPLNRTEGKGTEGDPPTVPQGGTGEIAFESLSPKAKEELRAATKIRVCNFVTFKGKNPSRPWGYAALCAMERHLPIPEEEFAAVEWFHNLAPADEVQELKARRQSETTLFENWSDEVTRANAYRKKNHAANGTGGVVKKEEPARWREFFRWHYSNPEIVLPETFDGLGRDQRAEYEKNFAAFSAKKEGVA